MEEAKESMAGFQGLCQHAASCKKLGGDERDRLSNCNCCSVMLQVRAEKAVNGCCACFASCVVYGWRLFWEFKAKLGKE